MLVGVAGCAWNDAAPLREEQSRTEAVSLSIHRASVTEQEGFEPALYEEQVTVYVDPRAVLTDGDVWQARVFGGERRGLVELTLTAPGTAALAELTRANVRRLLAVYVDGVLVMVTRVERPIEDGRVILSADFSPARAADIAAALNAQRAARSPLRPPARR
jgi:preprotein translocase subunit SecD